MKKLKERSFKKITGLFLTIVFSCAIAKASLATSPLIDAAPGIEPLTLIPIAPAPSLENVEDITL